MTAQTLTQAQREALEYSGGGMWLMRLANTGTLKALVRRGLLESKASGLLAGDLHRITPEGERVRRELEE